MSRIARALSVYLVSLAALCGSAQAWSKLIPPEQGHPKLETALEHLARQALTNPELGALAAREQGWRVEDERVTVVVETEVGVRPPWASVGAEALHAAPELGLWEVRIPWAAVQELANLSDVRFVRGPMRPQPVVTSEGVNLTGAATWHRRAELGQGVRVAVIDVEFGGLDQAVAAGELRVAWSRDYTGTGLGAGGHGVACAEIISDMAPQAELFLMKVDNEVQLAAAVRDAVQLGVQVISHSVAWFNTNFYDGTGVVCDIVRWATDRGILWVNAAGNFGDGAHWEGPWHDQDGDGLLDFGPGQNVNLFDAPADRALGLWLTWDGWPTTDQDYDLYLVQMPFGNIVASSTNNQTGGQPPGEQIVYYPLKAGTYGVVIRAYNAPGKPRLELYCTTQVKLQHAVKESSVPAPSDLESVLTVGAMGWSTWSGGPARPYTSQGPTNPSRLNARALVKPDLMGPDGVSTMTYGQGKFAGTSASAPHVAGAAAVVWAARPGWSGPDVRRWLEANAVDMGHPGKDNVYGAGRLQLVTEEPPPPPTGTSHTYGAKAGWYMVSVPAQGVSAEAFGGTLYWWNGSAYERVTSLDPTRGYWVRLPANKTVTVVGQASAADQVLVLAWAGWHQIGSPWPYAKDQIVVARGPETRPWREAVAMGWVRDNLFGWGADQGSYTDATALHPWYGYWIQTKVADVRVILKSAARLPTDLSVPHPLSPAVGLGSPPPPPGGDPVGIGVLIHPNPVMGYQPVTFVLDVTPGSRVLELRVQVFDLSNRCLWEGVGFPPALTWDMLDRKGQELAGGVYLVVILVELEDGRRFSQTRKLLILR